MSGSRGRVMAALHHKKPDRTPLFEIFQPFQPIHWDICGRTIATEAEKAWDAMADGVSQEEMNEASASAQYRMAKYFQLDMVRLNGAPHCGNPRPEKLGPGRWRLKGVEYVVNPRTRMVEPADPGQEAAMSKRVSEDEMRERILAWDGKAPSMDGHRKDPVLKRVQELAEADGSDIVFMAEIGVGTGVAFYPPFMLMWMALEPELYQRWLLMQKTSGLPRTRKLIGDGCPVVAMGGDISSDKGPFISPEMYREFILPVIQEHVNLIHEEGAMAVYTSDGNHWAIKEDFFFNSGVDGYKEVDNAAGMTWPRLIDEGVADRVCVIGNLDARHTLCHRSAAEARAETIECLKFGQKSKGGHILHASHSVHEDVIPANYHAAVAAYREFFGLPPLTKP